MDFNQERTGVDWSQINVPVIEELRALASTFDQAAILEDDSVGEGSDEARQLRRAADMIERAALNVLDWQVAKSKECELARQELIEAGKRLVSLKTYFNGVNMNLVAKYERVQQQNNDMVGALEKTLWYLDSFSESHGNRDAGDCAIFVRKVLKSRDC